MRKYLFGICAVTLSVPIAASSESTYVALGGIKVGPNHYNRYEGLYDRHESERCGMLRSVCTHREELGDQGLVHCRKYRELCD